MATLLQRWKIEAKVAASTAASAGIGIAAAVLNDVENDHALLGGLPAWLQTVLLILVPPLASFAAGYQTKHTPRPADPPAAVVPPAAAPPAASGPTGS